MTWTEYTRYSKWVHLFQRLKWHTWMCDVRTCNIIIYSLWWCNDLILKVVWCCNALSLLALKSTENVHSYKKYLNILLLLLLRISNSYWYFYCCYWYWLWYLLMLIEDVSAVSSDNYWYLLFVFPCQRSKIENTQRAK